MFRVKKVLQVFFHFSEDSLLNTVTIMLLLTLAMMIVTLFFPSLLYQYDALNYVYLVFSVATLIILIPRALLVWYQNKSQYYEPENYVILTLFSLSTAFIFGMISFSMQTMMPDTYVIDSVLMNSEKTTLTATNEDNASASKAVIRSCDSIAEKIMTIQDQVVLINKEENLFPEVSTKYNYSLGTIQLQLEDRQVRGDRSVTTMYFGTVRDSVTEVRFIPLHGVLKSNVVPLDLSRDVKPEILEMLRERRQWEVTNVLGQLQEDSLKIHTLQFNPSLLYYFYDSAMAMFGNSPGYFKPYSIQGRVIEILKTVFKYFYLSFLVGFLVKNFSMKTP